MATRPIHTVPYGRRWANTQEGSDRPIDIYPTEAEAEADGRAMAIAAGTDHIIHTLDGVAAERRRYRTGEPPPG